jgi:hypothetical protein
LDAALLSLNEHCSWCLQAVPQLLVLFKGQDVWSAAAAGAVDGQEALSAAAAGADLC